jgi:hypothetical protein
MIIFKINSPTQSARTNGDTAATTTTIRLSDSGAGVCEMFEIIADIDQPPIYLSPPTEHKKHLSHKVFVVSAIRNFFFKRLGSQKSFVRVVEGLFPPPNHYNPIQSNLQSFKKFS